MTKEQFEKELLKAVLEYKEIMLPNYNARLRPGAKITGRGKERYNPFEEFDGKYLNIKLISNLAGLNEVLDNHPELTVQEVNLLIMSNHKYKVLNQVLNFNTKFVQDLMDKKSSAMDIAIAYAIHCEVEDKYRNMPIR